MKELINKLFEVREISHQMHLMAKNGTQSTHEALEDFYDSLLEHIDLWVEVYQGQFELIEDYGIFSDVDFSDDIKYFEDFAIFLKQKRKEIVDDDTQHFDTFFDEVIIDTYKLLFKLKYLK